MAGSSVTRTAGVAGSFAYTLSQVPYAAPVMTIYSDAARTVVAVAAATLAATANPSVFTCLYPATLAPGTYYLSFSTVLTNGQPAIVDQDDMLVLVAASGSVAPAYASIADLRNFGLSVIQRKDDLAADDLVVASRLIDDVTGTQFYQAQQSVTVYDVRLPIVSLPLPFQDVTAVTVDGRAISATAYTVTPTGLRVYTSPYIDVDGFPTKVYSSVRAFRNPYGANVVVTGTFGYATVPDVVRRAATILAARIAVNTLPNMTPDRRVRSLTVEGYSRTFYPDSASDEASSTGDDEADRLLRRYSLSKVQVG